MSSTNPDPPDPDKPFKPPYPVDGGERNESNDDEQPLQLTTGSKRKDERPHEQIRKRQRVRFYSPNVEDWQAAALQYENTLPTYQSPSTSGTQPRYPRPTSTYPDPDAVYPHIDYQVEQPEFSLPDPAFLEPGPSSQLFEPIEPMEPSEPLPQVSEAPEPEREPQGSRAQSIKSRWLRNHRAEADSGTERVFQPIPSTSAQCTVPSEYVTMVSTSTQVEVGELGNVPLNDQIAKHPSGIQCAMCEGTVLCRERCLRDGSGTHAPLCVHAMELEIPSFADHLYRAYQDQERYGYLPMTPEFIVPDDPPDTARFARPAEVPSRSRRHRRLLE